MTTLRDVLYRFLLEQEAVLGTQEKLALRFGKGGHSSMNNLINHPEDGGLNVRHLDAWLENTPSSVKALLENLLRIAAELDQGQALAPVKPGAESHLAEGIRRVAALKSGKKSKPPKPGRAVNLRPSSKRK